MVEESPPDWLVKVAPASIVTLDVVNSPLRVRLPLCRVALLPAISPVTAMLPLVKRLAPVMVPAMDDPSLRMTVSAVRPPLAAVRRPPFDV